MYYQTFLTIFFSLSFCFASAQTSNPEIPPGKVFLVVNYMKVEKHQIGPYLTLEKEVYKKLHKERIKKGQLQGWYLFQVLSPSGEGVEYNYVTVDRYRSSKGLAAHYESWDIDFEKVLTEKERERMAKTDETRKLIKQEVFELRDGILRGKDGEVPPKFTIVNFMKLRPDPYTSEYEKMEKKYWKPLHAESIASKNKAGWAIYAKRMPAGEAETYDAAAVDFFDEFHQTLDDNFDEIFPKVHPDKTKEEVLAKTQVTRGLVQREVRILIDFVR